MSQRSLVYINKSRKTGVTQSQLYLKQLLHKVFNNLYKCFRLLFTCNNNFYVITQFFLHFLIIQLIFNFLFEQMNHNTQHTGNNSKHQTKQLEVYNLTIELTGHTLPLTQSHSVKLTCLQLVKWQDFQQLLLFKDSLSF